MHYALNGLSHKIDINSITADKCKYWRRCLCAYSYNIINTRRSTVLPNTKFEIQPKFSCPRAKFSAQCSNI